MRVKRGLRKVVPKPILSLWDGYRASRIRQAEGDLSLQEVFTTIYQKNRWGGEAGTFHSGAGSDDAISTPYVEAVRDFIAEKGVTSVLDIGCGDFRVGSRIVSPGVRYTGVDIVGPLIDANAATFGSPSIGFQQLNAVDDPLPVADLCLIRQVLQHLSNDQIMAILAKTDAFKYVVISEHHPATLVKPNVDKMPGTLIRVGEGSGVYIDRPPFSKPDTTVLLETPLATPIVAAGEVICTYLIDNAARV